MPKFYSRLDNFSPSQLDLRFWLIEIRISFSRYLFSILFQFCDAGIGIDKSTCGITSSSKLLIKGGTVVNAHHQQVADVYVEDGIIIAVEPNIKVCFINSTVKQFAAIRVCDFKRIGYGWRYVTLNLCYWMLCIHY